MANPEEEMFSRLEKEYEGTRFITIVHREDRAPTVQWDPALTENDVIAGLVRAVLFMTLDEYVSDIFDDILELDEDDETEQ